MIIIIKRWARIIRWAVNRIRIENNRLILLATSRGRLRIGTGSFVHPSVQILGMRQIAIGRNCIIAQDSWLNVNHRDHSVRSITVGDHCFIGRRNVFSSGLRIDIDSYVLTANDCFFLGSTHITSNPMKPIITTGTSNTDTIKIGANTFIGAGVRVIGNVIIGHGCVIGSGTVMTHDAPPFSLVFGTPGSVRQRYSFPRQTWVSVSEFTTADEASLPSLIEYLEILNKSPVPHLPLIAAGSDMGCC